MNNELMPLFSFLIPTRNRPEKLQRLFSSICETTSDLSHLEIVLAIDEDDEESKQVDDPRLKIKHVIVPPGKTMGFLNRACYSASSGRYLMLMNDDVILRTPQWDLIVKQCFETYQQDEIVLVHVNDLIYQDQLCTFPFVSRTYCELMENICPKKYIRYRIDDHIYNIFNLLAYLGYKRTVYLPDVIFEHDNYIKKNNIEREYVPNEEIIAIDIKWFDESLLQRKKDALKLIRHIEDKKLKREENRRYNLLSDVQDSYSIRRPEFMRVHHSQGQLSSASSRVTIGVVSADINNPHAQQSLQLIKEYTSNYDLIILDNNRGAGFNHPREMNRILSIAKTDYLVLMDDDVFVEPGWLDGLLKSLKDNTGVVTPLHQNKQGNLSYAGVFLMSNATGDHGHIIEIPEAPRPIPTLCSAILLIDLNKCGHLRFNERMNKYFLDIDFGLQVWELGYEVTCTPDVTVTHLAGATLTQRTQTSTQLYECDRQVFLEEWVRTGRLQKVEQGIWQEVPYIRSILELSQAVERLLVEQPTANFQRFRKQVEALLKATESFPFIKNELIRNIENYINNQVQSKEIKSLQTLINKAQNELNKRLVKTQGITGTQPDLNPSEQAEVERLQARIRAMESSKLWKLRTAWFRLKYHLLHDPDITQEDLQPYLVQPQATPTELRARIQAMESSKFWQIRTKWFRVKRTLKLTEEI